MNIHQVKIFYLAAQTLSITKTAKKMHLSQPSVSIQIKDLEDSLQVRLFDRISRKITLTDAGKVFYEYAGQILDLIEETKSVMSGFSSGDVGKITIGASNTLGIHVLPRFLGEFKEKNPNAEIALMTLNRHEAIEHIISGEIDFAFVQGLPRHPDIESQFFLRDELIVICSPKHKWAKLDYLTADVLKDNLEPFIIREEGAGTRDIVGFVAKSFGVKPKVAMELSSTEGIKAAVEANLGVALLSRHVVKREIKDGSLIGLELKDLSSYRDFYIIYNKKRKFMSIMAKFYEFVLGQQQQVDAMINC